MVSESLCNFYFTGLVSDLGKRVEELLLPLRLILAKIKPGLWIKDGMVCTLLYYSFSLLHSFTLAMIGSLLCFDIAFVLA